MIMTPESDMHPDFLEMLEEEFMVDVARKGLPQLRALHYAACEMEDNIFRTEMMGITAVLIAEAILEHTDAYVAHFARLGTQRFLACLEEHVAPAWARENYHKRLAEFEEMKAEQQEMA